MQTPEQIAEQNRQQAEQNRQNAQKQTPGQTDQSAPYGRDAQGKPNPRP
jgi:hypothetical protein